jgi:multiple antibiotic resistance protein
LFTFVPLFVAIDALGTVPIVMSLTEGMTGAERTRVVNTAMLVATVLALIFLFLGTTILALLDISVGHFAVAGGVILLALALKDMLTGKLVDPALKEELMAVVPLGTPLIAGPATVTTLILLASRYSYWIVLVSLALNLLLAWVVFWQGGLLTRFLGKGGLRAFSKVRSLLLAAIGVRMVLEGIVRVLGWG